ncbi:polypeptide N-acetylgalactosaminyltransferase 13-like [Mya arenaria]|uniref:polypeptide N-acetylgalactosaminyltransferase 13-like n=1 Tax=Mya arenaria TaxID=6604 RepID=UPI0022E08F14|nr:polypeptide N-acetylgalactosaminyltransferase 13-like [Mya arenaria]
MDQGPGAMGSKVDIGYLHDDPDYIKRRNESLKYGMNMFISDLIGLRRTLADRRSQKCKEMVYPGNLPTASIIIIFRDEPLSTLMRTVYGVFDTCPSELLEEIILVDDGTVDRSTVIGVQIHVRNMNKAILIRNEKSRGLMMARQQGIERARSGYFIVLDSHIEFNIGWLEPILHRLVQEPNALLTSHVGAIDRESFEYIIGDANTLFLCFEQITINEQWARFSDEFILKRNGSMDPIPFCMVPGMMMAMRKEFFLQLGGFDQGMEVWGSEHIEIIIIIFRDEPLSTLMRTVYGDTCPSELLEEIILVKNVTVDRSTVIGVQIHVRNMDNVILIRSEKSRGLMMARQQGIERARSVYFIVLDSHIEFNIGWLEPVLNRLVQEPNAKHLMLER